MPINEKDVIWDESVPSESDVVWDDNSSFTPSPKGNQSLANKTLNDGLFKNSNPDDVAFAESVSKPQDMELLTAKKYYNEKFGVDHTPEMVLGQIEYEYGKDATPQTANAMNKKAAKWQASMFGDSVKAFGLKTLSAIQMAPKMLDEQNEIKNKAEEKLGLPKNFINNMIRLGGRTTGGDVFVDMGARLHEELAKRKVDSVAELAYKNIEKAGEIQSKYMSGVPIEESMKNGDWETVGEDFGTAVLFELPNLATQLGLASLSAGGSLAYMGASAAAQERASMGENEDLVRNVIEPFLVGGLEVATEKFIGTGRIIDRVASGKIVNGFMKKVNMLGLDLLGGAASEGSATYGGNILDKAFGDDVSAFKDVPMSMMVGAFMDSGVNLTSSAFSQGDATRIRKQNSNAQINEIIQNDPILSETPEHAEAAMKAFTNPEAQENVEALNRIILEPKEEATGEEQTDQSTAEGDTITTPEGAEVTIDNGSIVKGTDTVIGKDDIGDDLIYSHRRNDGVHPSDTGYVVQFTRNSDENKHYGDQNYLLKEADLAEIPQFVYDEALLWMQENINKNADEQHAENMVNPYNIEDGAGIWDEDTFIQQLKNNREEELSGVIGFKLADGGIAIYPERASFSIEGDPITIETESQQVAPERIESLDDLADVNRSKSRVMNKVMTPVREVIGDISPTLKAGLDRWEFNTHQRKRQYSVDSTPWMETAYNISKQDSAKYTEGQLHLKNRNFDEAEKIFGKEIVDNVKQQTAKMAADMKESGYEFDEMEDYFPRRVKDLEGLREDLGTEMSSMIDDAINEQARKAEAKGYKLSDIEIEKIINQVVSGAYRPVGGRKPRSLKRRTIDEITPELDKHYYDALDSWIMNMNEVADIIELRKFLGKNVVEDGGVVDMNESIGALINDVIEREGLSEKDANKLIGVLRSRIGYRVSGKKTSAYRTMTAMTTLGQVTSSLTQLGDYTWSMYENGLFDTLSGTGDVINKSGITLEDLGLDEISAEFSTPQGMSNAVNTLFKYTGLKGIDKLGKETLVNATLKQYQDQAEAGKFSDDKQDRLDVLFGAEQDQVIADLKSGTKSDDVKLLMFSTLLDWQPMTLSNMPQAYLDHPTGRLFYTLKTFTIKQMDNFRRVAIDDMVEGVATGDMQMAALGFGRLMKLAGIMLALNIPIDMLKDWITGKEVSFSDQLIDNLFKILGFSRYTVERSARKGQKLSHTMMKEFIPPLAWVDLPAEDIKTAINQLEKGDDIDIGDFESWQMFPFLGRSYYWRYGGGKKKLEKWEKQESNK